MGFAIADLDENERRKHQWKKRRKFSSMAVTSTFQQMWGKMASGLSILNKCQQTNLKGISVSLQCPSHMNVGCNGLPRHCTSLENLSIEYSGTVWQIVRNNRPGNIWLMILQQKWAVSESLSCVQKNKNKNVLVLWIETLSEYFLWLFPLRGYLFIPLSRSPAAHSAVIFVGTVVQSHYHQFSSQLNLPRLTIIILTSACSVMFSHSDCLPHYFSSLEAIDMNNP